jgi:hypothetical protein
MATKPKLANEVKISNKAPHHWPREEKDAEGNVVQPAVYAGLMVQADARIGDTHRSGPHCVDVPEDATDAQIHAAILAQYGVQP